VAVDAYRSALATVYPGKADEIELIDYFGHDESLAHLCLACAEMLSMQTPGNSKRIAHLTQLFASFLVDDNSCKNAHQRRISTVRSKPNSSAGCHWKLSQSSLSAIV
jgi:hypothetical protein